MKNHINTTMFNVGINKNFSSLSDFLDRIWSAINEVIDISNSEVYSYEGNMDCDPFGDSRSM